MKKTIRQRTDVVGHLPENLKPKEPLAIELKPVPRDGGRHHVVIYNTNVPEGESRPVAWTGPIDASLVPSLIQWIKVQSIALQYHPANPNIPIGVPPLTHDETGRIRPDRSRSYSDIAMNDMMDQWGRIIDGQGRVTDRTGRVEEMAPGMDSQGNILRRTRALPPDPNPTHERAVQVVDALRARGIDPSAPVDRIAMVTAEQSASPVAERTLLMFVDRADHIMPMLTTATQQAREEAIEAIRQDINRTTSTPIPESVGRILVDRMIRGIVPVIDREVIDVSRHGDAPNRRVMSVLSNPVESPQQSWARERWERSLAGRAQAMHEGHRIDAPAEGEVNSAQAQLDMVQRELQELMEGRPPGHIYGLDVARRIDVLRDAERTLQSVIPRATQPTVRLTANRRSREMGRWTVIDEASNVDNIMLDSERDPDRNNRTE